MHIDEQVTLSVLVMLFSSRGTETAKVEGLWLINRPKCLVPEHPTALRFGSALLL